MEDDDEYSAVLYSSSAATKASSEYSTIEAVEAAEPVAVPATYEQTRANNIERNKQVLLSLGFLPSNQSIGIESNAVEHVVLSSHDDLKLIVCNHAVKIQKLWNELRVSFPHRLELIRSLSSYLDTVSLIINA